MSLLSSLIEPALKPVMDKAAAMIPVHWQVRGAHAVQNVKQRTGRSRAVPVFQEAPLPDVSTLALQDIDVSNPFLYRQGLWRSYFKRLRDECPVHFQKHSPFGPFWSITRYEDILFVDTRHDLFSAEPIISIGPQPEGLEIETFIAMDPPKHDAQRQAVQGVVAPKNLAQMEALIRSRTADVLDHLPVDEPLTGSNGYRLNSLPVCWPPCSISPLSSATNWLTGRMWPPARRNPPGARQP